MRKLLTVWIVLAAIVGAGVSALAQGGMFPGPGTAHFYPGPGGYTGPGDVITFTSWWGLRAYSAAKAAATGPCVDLVDQAGANTVTINSKTDGTLDAAAIATWVAAHSVSTIKVAKIYDQVGTQHLTQATLANMPTLTANALGTSYGMTFTNANATALILFGTNPPTSAVPISTTIVFKNPAGAADYGMFSLDPGDYSGIVIDSLSSGTQLGVYNGASFAVTAALNTWHASSLVINSTSSAINVDGTDSPGLSGGTQGVPASSTIRLGEEAGAGNKSFSGLMMEAGYLAGTAFSAGNRTNLNSNMHAAYGGW